MFLRQPFNTAFGKQFSSFVGDSKFLLSADFSAAMGMGLWRDGGRFGSTSVFNPAGSCVGASRLPCWSPAASAIAGLGDWARASATLVLEKIRRGSASQTPLARANARSDDSPWRGAIGEFVWVRFRPPEGACYQKSFSVSPALKLMRRRFANHISSYQVSCALGPKAQ